MAKIPFDIKFKPQIKSGDYKVVTKDNHPVSILCWDKYTRGLDKIVALVAGDSGKVKTLHYTEEGWFIAGNRNKDLFIVTPEPELTEWGRTISACIQKHGLLDCGAADRIAKESAAELLDLARKEIEEELKEKVLHDYWKQASDQCAQARKEAKAEALKDLPRWEKCGVDTGQTNLIRGYSRDEDMLYRNGRQISLMSLEKLPGFKED